MTIAIVSHKDDDHAAAVARALCAQGSPPRLIDTADFPTVLRVSFQVDGHAPSIRASGSGPALDLRDLTAIWWRRPQPYRLDPSLDPKVAAFVYSECHEAMAGILHALRVHWVNPPDADEVAHHKPLQLAVAQNAGLSVPRSLVTNDPEAARAFVAEATGPTIYKTFLAHETQWRETRLVTEAELHAIDKVALAPVIFQEFVEAEADLRITVFKDEILAAEIVSPPDSYVYDYRVHLDSVTMRPARLPGEVESGILELMRQLGLTYGAIDMRRTADGEHVFLEINPAGEFLFVERQSGLPLTNAMAALLIRLDKAPLEGLG